MPDLPAVFQPSTSPPKLDLANANSQLFQVPSSTSASCSLHSLSLSRKRPRRNTENLSTIFDSRHEAPSPSPLLQSDSRKISGSDDLHAAAELDYRPDRYRKSFLPPSLGESVESVVNPDAPKPSRKRSRRDSCVASPSVDGTSEAPARAGWGRTVIKAVGKVLDLCWSGAFRGFYAGGGQGYNMQAGSPTQFNPHWQQASPAEKGCDYRTPIPGQYPEEEIERNWVVIPTEPADPFVGNDSAGSPSLRARRVHPASNPRRRPAVMPRSIKRAATPSLRPSTPTRSPGLASPRAKDGASSGDMQRHAAQLRRKEREEDASIRRLNKQLQTMIRQGKEALGTTVEVDDLDMDCD